MTDLLKRPDCFDFAMDFVGDPEEPKIRAYVEALESALAKASQSSRLPTPSPRPSALVDRVEGALDCDGYNPNSEREARAAIREVAAWLRSEYPHREGYGTAWAKLLDDHANQ